MELGHFDVSYMKSNDKAIYFVGPTRTDVAVSAADGRLLWQYPVGNCRPVLRDEGLYVLAAREGNEDSLLLDPLSGKTLANLGCRRGNCTRPTGAADAFFAAREANRGIGEPRVAGNRFRRLPLVRPPCHDGYHRRRAGPLGHLDLRLQRVDDREHHAGASRRL